MKANTNIKNNKELLKYEDLQPFVDMDKIKYENIDKLNQVELFVLNNKTGVSKWKLGVLGVATVGYFGYMTWLAIRKGPSYMAKLTADKPKNLGTMLSVGSKITGKIFLGYMLVALPIVFASGLDEEVRRNTRVKYYLGNSMIINDDELQEFILMQTLGYF